MNPGAGPPPAHQHFSRQPLISMASGGPEQMPAPAGGPTGHATLHNLISMAIGSAPMPAPAKAPVTQQPDTPLTLADMQQPAPTMASLLDMPVSWLQQLPAALGPDILPLFATCRASRDLILGLRQVHLGLVLPLSSSQEEAARTKMLLACKYSSNVQVSFEGQHSPRSPESAARLMTTAMAALGEGLKGITHVTVQTLELDAFVPSWLNATCPNMHTLHIRNCPFGRLPSPSLTLPVCPQLRRLHLTQYFERLPKKDRSWLKWQQQLRALTGLECLVLDDRTHAQLMVCVSVIGSQLTELSIPSLSLGGGSCMQLASWFPRLSVLHLLGETVDDAGMEALLSAPTLRKVQCNGFQLEQSYTARRCNWSHLGTAQLDVASFDRLPLGAVQFTGAPVHKVIPSRELGANERVAVAAVRWGVQWGSHVHMDNQRAAGSACIAALMPLMGACKAKEFTLSNVWQVTPELITALGTHLHSAGIMRLLFNQCTLTPEAWPGLLRGLPPITSLSVTSREGEVEETDVTEMCVRACRPIQVRLSYGGSQWQEGWQERVEAAMAAAGHQHVKLYNQPQLPQYTLASGAITTNP